MIAAKEIRLVLVTPETTLLDEPALSLRLPLFDGQMGILPGRAPLVGRLGYGELRITGQQTEKSYYVDGGFVQVKGSVVSILTHRAIPVEKLNLPELEARLAEVVEMPAKSEEEFATKHTEMERTRRMIALAKKQG